MGTCIILKDYFLSVTLSLERHGQEVYMSHGTVSSETLDGDAVLNEGRIQVGVGQCQALVPLPDAIGDLDQLSLEGSHASPWGILCEVFIWIVAQRPLGTKHRVELRSSPSSEQLHPTMAGYTHSVSPGPVTLHRPWLSLTLSLPQGFS